MAEAGAPIGNQNARKAKIWTQAIERALKKRSKSAADMIEALDELAEKLLIECDSGNLIALKELADRLEGKPVQGIEGTIEHDHTGTVTHDHKSGMDFEKIMEERQKLRLVK